MTRSSRFGAAAAVAALALGALTASGAVADAPLQHGLIQASAADGGVMPLTYAQTAQVVRDLSKRPAPSSVNAPVWLDELNALRASFRAGPVTIDPELNRTAEIHSNYMMLNETISHEEDPSKPGYSPEGHKAGTSSNVAMSGYSADPSHFIDIWATAPFHAIGLLRPELKKVGYGSKTAKGMTYATINVIQGATGPEPRDGWPRVFPNGPDAKYLAYSGAEWPDPTVPCGGDQIEFGMPIIIDFGERANITKASATLKAGDKEIKVCTTLAKDFKESWALGPQRVLLMPPGKFSKGVRYTGTVTTNVGNATIDFTTRK